MEVKRLCVQSFAFPSRFCPLFRPFLPPLVAVALRYPRVIPAKLVLESIFQSILLK